MPSPQRRDSSPPRALPWAWLHRHAWPEEIARLTAAALALSWVIVLAFRRGLCFAREVLLAIGGVLLLSPTVHPWYLLWVLPLAAALASAPWLALGALVFLGYVGGAADVPVGVRVVEYGVPLAVACAGAAIRSRVRRAAAPPPPPGAR